MPRVVAASPRRAWSTAVPTSPLRPCRQVGLVQHDDMRNPARIRAATAIDAAQLLSLWSLVFNEDDTALTTAWGQHAQGWFTRFVDDRTVARFPVIQVDGDIVATAIGTLELGVPNPQCPRGRTVRLANVITLPGYRGRGYGTLLVRDVIDWARSIDADRVDLSATPDGQRIYEKIGFTLARAPRMKFVL
jgi:GNAT superfamily N-acetyltransferase